MTDDLMPRSVRRSSAVACEMKTTRALLVSLAKRLELPDAAIKLVANVETLSGRYLECELTLYPLALVFLQEH